MKQTLRSIGVLSCAKITAAIYFALGLLIVPFILVGAVAGTLAGPMSNALGSVALIVIGVLAPVFYGAMGFVIGAFSAFVYNLFAGWLGGLELVLQAPVTTITAGLAPPA